MKLLIVAMADSIHTRRWISHITDQEWDIYLFPTNSFTAVHPEMPAVKIYKSMFLDFLINKFKSRKKTDGSSDYSLMGNVDMFSRGEVLKKFLPDRRISRLISVIKRKKPDLIHSMHIQESGYLVLEAKKRLKGTFPAWLVTNWGSELNLFSKVSFHRDRIKEVLLNCDYLSGECSSDEKMARELGFKGRFLPVIPNSGGIDFSEIDRIKKQTPTSVRRNIMLKGYQNWAGRSLVGLRALERCADMLRGYRILIYSAYTVDVIVAAELFTEKTGVETSMIPLSTSHAEILAYHGSSRISIGLSITDAISTSLLEAMVMGSFPIQSNTSCADEWFRDGKTGILVEPEDPEDIEKAIRKALEDDELVNNASVLNYNALKKRLEYSKVRSKVIKNYKSLVRD
jgi:glycosyltransferase involved in cell wall biosynthesis